MDGSSTLCRGLHGGDSSRILRMPRFWTVFCYKQQQTEQNEQEEQEEQEELPVCLCLLCLPPMAI